MTPGAIDYRMNSHASQTVRSENGEFLVEALAASSLCAGLEWADVAVLARHAEVRRFAPLKEAITEGQQPHELYVVISGRFVVLLPSQQLDKHGAGAIVNLDSFVAGDCFGHTGLVEDLAAPASIIATERSEAVAIPLPAIGAVTADDHRVGRTIYGNLFAIQTRRLALLTG